MFSQPSFRLAGLGLQGVLGGLVALLQTDTNLVPGSHGDRGFWKKYWLTMIGGSNDITKTIRNMYKIIG